MEKSITHDNCVICGRETPYTVETHIDNRIGYIEGMGQLCLGCFEDEVDDNVICVPKKVIWDTPNDFELGSKIRNLSNMK
jgi:hypothetical protein